MNSLFRKICVVGLAVTFLGAIGPAFFKWNMLAYAAGTIYIRAEGSVDPPSSQIDRDGNIYRLTGDIAGGIVVQRSNIIIEAGMGMFGIHGPGNGTGFSLEGTYDNPLTNVTIIGVIIENFAHGILLDYAHNNRISCNGIQDNDVGVVFFGSQSRNNTVVGNYIGRNDVGVEVYTGSGSNLIYMNTFHNNGQHVKVWGVASTTPNSWDIPYRHGNYWSNYTGVDASPIDGIGDTPHVINTYNVDHNPLMYMWSGTYRESFVDGEWVSFYIGVISNSTEVGPVLLVPMDTEGDALKCNVSGPDGTMGFCRVTLPHPLLDPPYNVTVNGFQIIHDTVFENDTLSIIYFTYPHSTKEVVIVPEFQAFMILPLFMIASLFTVVVRRKGREQMASS